MASYNLGKVVGDDGASLEYDWEGTSLGIKRDDEAEYTYVDLKGDTGATGSTGASGSDGYSPTVQTSKEGKTTTIEITDKNGSHTATIQDGVDGTSPTASVSKSGNTATITIIDKNGTTTASVSDGTNGTNGRDGYVQYTAGSNISIDNNVISATDTTYIAGNNVYIDPSDNSINVDVSFKQDIMQYELMPTAGIDYQNKIVQYIGTTTNNYTNGYFYKCVEDDSVYSWENIQVQTSGSSGGNDVFVVTYGDTEANLIATGQNIVNYYIQNNHFPTIKVIYDGKEYNTMYWRYYNSTYEFSIYYIEAFDDGDTVGMPYFYYDGKLQIAENSNTHIVSSVTIPKNQTSGNANYRKGYIGTPFQYSFYNSLAANYMKKSMFLAIGNTKEYTPTTGSYNPATAKYCEDYVNPTITTDNNTTYTIASLIGNQTYKLGELTSLTITATTTFDRESIIYFTSGSTATSVSLPDSITNLGDAPTFTASGGVNTGSCEASKSYIIAILNNIAVWKAY